MDENVEFQNLTMAYLTCISKNLPVMQETRVWSLGREDPLEKGMAIHSSILAWRILWTKEPADLTVCGFAKSQTRLSD